jgi:hypothetical protein
VREPFRTLESVKNTFGGQLDARQFVERWVRTCRFGHTHDRSRTVVVQMDRLRQATTAERQSAMQCVLRCVGVQATDETDAFIREWPEVHKVTASEDRHFAITDDARQSLLDEVPTLREWILRMGYRP